MRVSQVERKVEITGAVSQEQFTIAMNAKMFEMLSKKVYERPAEAVLREICANAYDSNREAGNGDEPITVVMPTLLVPVLRVRDNGLGMSHDFVMRNYTKYGESTKDGSDESIGGFGLGCKSPFAVTDTFTVISRHEGVQRTYTAVIGTTGFPTINCLDEHPTDERNGVEVIVPCSDDMLRKFTEAAPKVFEYYDVMPTFKNYDARQINQLREQLLLDTDTLTMYKNNNYYRESSLRIQMGIVGYPVELGEMDISRDVRDFISNLRLTLKLPIGSVPLAPSRERLNYDNETIKLLADALNDARQEILDYYLEPVHSISEYYEACCAFIKVRENLPFLPSEYTHGDRTLRTATTFTFNKKRGFSVIKAGRSELYNGRMPRATNDNRVNIAYDPKTIFVIDDVYRCHARAERIERACRDHTTVVILSSSRLNHDNHDTVSHALDVELQDIFRQIGYPNEDQFCILSETEEVEKHRNNTGGWRTSVGGIRLATERFRAKPRAVSNNDGVLSATTEPKEDDEGNLLLPADALYVNMSRGKPTIQESVIYQFVMNDPRPLYFIPKTLIKKIPESWKPLESVVDGIVDKVRVSSYIKLKKLYDNQKLSHGALYKLMNNKNTPTRNRILAFVEKYPENQLSQLIKMYQRAHTHKANAHIDAVITYKHVPLVNSIEFRTTKKVNTLFAGFEHAHYLLFRAITSLGENTYSSSHKQQAYKMIDNVLDTVYGV